MYTKGDAVLLPIAWQMQKYINTPWDEKGPYDIDDKSVPPQHHSGRNVLAHSFWSAVQIYQWYLERSPFIDLDIDAREAMVAAFLHDISKASHCEQTCIGDKCWLDPYSPNLNHSAHPRVSGDILLGLPDEFYQEMNLDKRVIALTAYMHWELGKIHRSFLSKSSIENYLNLFEQYSFRCGMAPTIQNLKKCILVSLADIRGSYPPDSCRAEQDCSRLVKHLTEERVPILSVLASSLGTPLNVDAFYPCTKPWTKYNMKEKSILLRKQLLTSAHVRGYSMYNTTIEKKTHMSEKMSFWDSKSPPQSPPSPLFPELLLVRPQDSDFKLPETIPESIQDLEEARVDEPLPDLTVEEVLQEIQRMNRQRPGHAEFPDFVMEAFRRAQAYRR